MGAAGTRLHGAGLTFRAEPVPERRESRADPKLVTIQAFFFDDMERASEIPDKKLENVIKPLIMF